MQTRTELEERSTREKLQDELGLLGTFAYVILSEYSTLISILVAVPLVFLGGFWMLNGTLPTVSIPSWVWVYSALFILAGVVTWGRQSWAIKQMEQMGEIIHDVAPKSGDFGVYEVEPEQFEELTVMAPAGVTENEDGEEEVVYEETNKSQLDTVNCRFGVAYECTEYDPDSNVAYVSWMAGASPTEVRASKMMIERVETKLNLLADAGLEEAVNRPEIIRKVAAQVTLYLVKCHQKATLPGGDEVAGIVTESLQKQLDVDVMEIENRVEEQMPEKYDQVYQGGEVNLQEEHRQQAKRRGQADASQSEGEKA
ncbi:hypothetical protein [Halolamina salifodinae]|uniref:Uncharacterized protein n=1 Tax=Halolamina salifodinae TaxID=1202767 RepID=A0A8T4GWE2_9EURY|nr:hypothetical protein [Halolamina salifodinae]MBP1986770.1 hypothetical protein [Halolamina salifodinae]